MPANPKLIDKLYSRLASEQANALRKTVSLAETAGLTAYLVGGPVRDLLLDRDSSDLDVAIEGDAVSLAEEIAADLAAKVRRYPQFGTAAVRGDGWHIDLITARRETYAHAGALPTVHPDTIQEDLARRDITINAMALPLNGPDTSTILDPHGGQSDLDAGLIRVLHERSLQDDATRIFRASRYATRFGFQIEPETLAWLELDLSYIDTIGGARIRREFERTFEEERPDAALMRLHALGVLKATHHGLTMTHAQSQAFAQSPFSRPIAFALLAWETPANEVAPVAKRLALTNAQSDAVQAVPTVRELANEPLADLPLSRLDALLAQFPLATVTALSIIDEDDAGPTVKSWLQARTTRSILRGDDLIALGVTRGPALGEALARLRAAKLDREVHTRADEEAHVREYLTNQK
jgi:tRNA nucleotidyltransferase (CCA-adding enzyme)